MPEITIAASLFQYDIPTSRDPREQYPNPSRQLRRIGFRSSLSVWVIPNDRIPWGLVHDMQNNGVKCWVIPFSADAGGQIAEMAQAAFRAEVAGAIESARSSKESAEARVSRNPEERHKYWSRVRAGINRAKRALKDAEYAARVFKLSGQLDIYRGMDELRAIHTDAKFKLATYVRMACELDRANGLNAGGLAKAAMTNELPAGIGADYLEESGECEVAEEVRKIA